MLQVLQERRAKGSFTDLVTSITYEFQFNPTEFTETIEVNYARQTVPGLSHEVLQYVNTKNDKFELELFFVADNREQLIRNLGARRLLSSYAYPREVDPTLIGGGPPRVLFLWPQFISLVCVFTNISFTYQRFSPEGLPLQFIANVTLEEMREVRLLQDDILTSGTRRADPQSLLVNEEDIEFVED